MGVVSPKKAASVPSHHHHKLSQDVGKCELQVGGLYGATSALSPLTVILTYSTTRKYVFILFTPYK